MSTTTNGIDLHKFIHRLIEERKRLDQVISFLEKLGAEGAPSAKGAAEGTPKRRGRKFMSPEERRIVSERMKEYWRARRTSQDAGASGNETAPPANKAPKRPAGAGQMLKPGKRNQTVKKNAAGPE